MFVERTMREIAQPHRGDMFVERAMREIAQPRRGDMFVERALMGLPQPRRGGMGFDAHPAQDAAGQTMPPPRGLGIVRLASL
jgi:hypothetical protein